MMSLDQVFPRVSLTSFSFDLENHLYDRFLKACFDSDENMQMYAQANSCLMRPEIPQNLVGNDASSKVALKSAYLLSSIYFNGYNGLPPDFISEFSMAQD